MGALDELLKVPYEKATSLQKALLVLFEDEVGYEALAGEAAAELAEKDAELARLQEQVKAKNLRIIGLLNFYNQEDDEFSERYWVDENYSLVSKDDEKRKWILTAKQIEARRAQIELEAQ